MEYDPLGVGDGGAVASLPASRRRVIHATSSPSRRVAASSPDGARFHSEGRSPGNGNHPKIPVVSPERASPRTTCDDPLRPVAAPRVVGHRRPPRGALCHPVGVSKWLMGRVPRAMPWAVENDPLGVCDGGAVTSRVFAPASRNATRAAFPVVIDAMCRAASRGAALLPSRRVAASIPEGARFHSEGRSPGNGNHPKIPVVSPERAPPASAIGVVQAPRCRDRDCDFSSPRIQSCTRKNARGVQ